MKKSKSIRPGKFDQVNYLEVKSIPKNKVPAFVTLFYRIAAKIGGIEKTNKRLKIRSETIYEMKKGLLPEARARKILTLYNELFGK